MNYAFIETNQHSSRTKRHDNAAARVDAEIKRVRRQLHLRRERLAAFDSLVAIVRSRTDLLQPTPGQGSAACVAPVFLIRRLRNLAERQGQWLRRCEDWQASGKSLRLEFRFLASYLLALYPVPGFMDSVWDLPPGPEAFRQQAWYMRAARGASLRTLNLPLTITKRMEHYIRQTPDHYTVPQALRYGETLGLGGCVKLALEVAASKLGQSVEHFEFWRTVLLFFVNHPEMDLVLVKPIIDFVQANKFAGEEIVTAHGTGHRQAPWPDFSIKGRTVASMLRLVQEWNADVTERKPNHGFSWPLSNVQGFRFVENGDAPENPMEWTIHELVSSAELYLEGRALRHCVYTYAPKCRRGETTIWSLRLRVGGQEKRMATIEVNTRKGEIIQTRAKANSHAGPRSQEMIRQWAAVAGLHVNSRSW